MTLKNSTEIVPGDIVVFFGRSHRIMRIDPASPETMAIDPSTVGIARAEDGWGITLAGPYTMLEVV